MRTIANTVDVPDASQRGPTGVPVIAADANGLPVFIQGGTSTFVFNGSIHADIGDVGIVDKSGNFAEVPRADSAKTGANKALLVQHIDPTGTPLSQASLTKAMNNQGTLATEVTLAGVSSGITALQTGQNTTNSLLSNVNGSTAALVNAQGTLATQETLVRVANSGSVVTSRLASIDLSTYQTLTTVENVMNNQGTLATQATLAGASNTLTAILNAQGTQAPSATQTAILNNQGTLATQTTLAEVLTALQQQAAAAAAAGTNLEATLFSSRYTTGDSVTVDVSGYLHHTIQHVINGNVTVITKTSLDGVNWHVESTDTNSTMFRLTGAAKYVQATYAAGSGTLTTMLSSLRGGGSGGGAVNGSGPAETGFSGTFSAALDSTYVLPVNGANSVGLHVQAPAGCLIQFEGSWNGTEYTDITLRQMGADGYAKTAFGHEEWIGSVATFKFFRLRVIQGAAGNITVTGRFAYAPSTLEGVEHGPMPHRFGASVEVQHFAYTAATSNGTVYAPSNPARRLAVTDLVFTVEGATSVVTFSDGSLADSKVVFRGRINPPTGGCYVVPIHFSTPHVFSGTGRPLCFTQSANANVDGIIHCYQTE